MRLSLPLKICTLAILVFGFAGVPSYAREITAQDLGVKEPRILPDSPLYLFKEISRFFSSVFDLNANPVHKARRRLLLTSEKLLEAHRLSEKPEISKELLDASLGDYQRQFNSLKLEIENMPPKIRSEGVEKERENFLREASAIFLKYSALLTGISERRSSPVVERSAVETIDGLNLVLEELPRDELVQKSAGKSYIELVKKDLAKADPKISQSLKDLAVNIINVHEAGQKPETAEAEKCAEVYRPVCGADTKTYSNRCEADKAQVRMASRGECEVKEEKKEEAVKPQAPSPLPLAGQTILELHAPVSLTEEELTRKVEEITNLIDERIAGIESLLD